MRYADDAVLIAENKEDLPQLLDITEEGKQKERIWIKEQKYRSNSRQSKQ